MNTNNQETPRAWVTLIGPMGCGKSAVARHLGQLLGLPVIDLDDAIERRAGKSIRDIFASEGEAGFRDRERLTLLSTLRGDACGVIATGGGVCTVPDNLPTLQLGGIVVYLKASPQTLAGRLTKAEVSKRPKLQGAKSIEELFDKISDVLSEREDAYMEAADHVQRTDHLTPLEVAQSIAANLPTAWLLRRRRRGLLQAVAFDCDGVVLDTEPEYTEIWGRIGREMLPGMPDFAQRIKGTTLAEILHKYFPAPDQQREVRRRLEEYEAGEMRYAYKAGVVEFIGRLRSRGVRTALVTSSDRTKMGHVYDTLADLPGLFDVVVTAEDVRRGKPDSECYIKAAELLGCRPERLAVVEDSVNGLVAANDEGITCVGLAGTFREEELSHHAHLTATSYEEAWRLLERGGLL